MEKKDIHNMEGQYECAINSVKACKDISNVDKNRIEQFVSDCIIGKNSKKKVGKSRLRRYLQNMTLLAGYFQKPFLEITDKDIERFYRELQMDKIRKNDDKPYSPSTKNEFVKTLKKFGRWLYYDRLDKYQKIYGWLKDFDERTEIPALTKEEIEKLAQTSTPRDAALLMFMFDSGARAEELLNIKKEDLKEEQIGKDIFYKVRIKVSKTKPRTITIPLATPYLKRWLTTSPMKEDEFLFSLDYDYLRKILYRKGKTIGKRIYPHLFRHSSATYYCNKLNQYQLCYRYGWTMSSDQPQRYIDREGIEEEKTAKLITSDEISKFKEENETLKEEIIMLKQQMEESFFNRLNLIERKLNLTSESLKKSGGKFNAVRPVTKEEMARGR